MKEITKHHRKPQSKKGTDDKSNISFVPIKKHEAWHTLFQDNHPLYICSQINNVWLDPDFKFFVYRKRKLRTIPKSKLKWSIH